MVKSAWYLHKMPYSMCLHRDQKIKFRLRGAAYGL
jgi:hypothetical protein